MKPIRQSDLAARVAATVRSHAMAPPGTRLGLAVSGGADSVALLLLLHDLRAAWGVSLAVLHLNHQLRGAESDADEQFVAALARRFGLELLSGRDDAAALARRRGTNLEETARRLRRGFFEQSIATGRVTRVATAHTLDDQAETVLAHLLRGSGITGLAGIHPVAGKVVRPLLDIGRQDLRRFLAERGQSWREDASNQDTTRLRARLRHTLLPLLEREFTPSAVERLARLAGHARREEAFWEAWLDERMRRTCIRDGAVSVAVGDLLDLREGRPATRGALQPGSQQAGGRRLARRIFRELTGAVAGLTAGHVEQALELASGGRAPRRIAWPRGVTVERTLDHCLLFALPRARTTPAPQPYHYVVPLHAAPSAAVALPHLGKRVRFDGIDWPAQGSDTSGEGPNALDAARLGATLVLRNWRPGDAYRPRGRRQVRKLKRLFWERGVPAAERASWPVLEADGRVVWAWSFGAAEDAAAGAATRRAIVVREETI